MLRTFRERVGRREIEVAVVAAQSARDECGDGIAEDRGVAWRPADGGGIDESRGEGVAATGGVDDVDGERRNLLSPFAVDDQRSVGAAGDGEQSCAGIKELAAPVGKVRGSGEAEDLVLVGQ